MHRSLLDDLCQDVRHAARTFGKRGMSATAVLILGLGIGGATAIFSVVNGVLLKPLPYADPEALVRIVHRIGGVEQPYFSDAIYLTYVNNGQAFEDLGVWSPGESATITGSGEPEEVRAVTASRGVLTTLRVRAEIGRWFSAAEDAPGASRHGHPLQRLLAPAVWRRPPDAGTSHHRQRPPPPDRRRDASEISASRGTSTSSCPCGSIRVRHSPGSGCSVSRG